MIDIQGAIENPNVLQNLTGLNPEEFRELAAVFDQVWRRHTRPNWEGQPRKRAPGAGPKGQLRRSEDKLFFILYYLRQYPIQKVLGFHFGFDQPQANKWIMRLAPLLQEALRQLWALPRRHTRGLGNTLAQDRQLKSLLDGTDRPVRRPKDPEKQKQRYSGRKKRHTVKNVLLTEERIVKFLSTTAPGCQTDKTLAEPLEKVAFPKKKLLITDLGFLGLKLQNVVLAQAARKPKNRPLLPALQTFNRIVARARVKVEHVISGIKRCRIVSDTLRHIKTGFEDLVMEVACGLHNFREARRQVSNSVLAPIQMN